MKFSLLSHISLGRGWKEKLYFDSNSQYQEVPLQDKGVGVGGIVSVLFSPPHPREGNKVALQRAGAEQTNAIQISLITPRYESHLAHAWHILHTIKYFLHPRQIYVINTCIPRGWYSFCKETTCIFTKIFLQQIAYDETISLKRSEKKIFPLS